MVSVTIYKTFWQNLTLKFAVYATDEVRNRSRVLQRYVDNSTKQKEARCECIGIKTELVIQFEAKLQRSV